jgi:WD40 repeat protein
VFLSVSVSDVNGNAPVPVLEHSTGSTFVPATVLRRGGTSTEAWVVWDSIADAPANRPMTLRWRCADPDGEVTVAEAVTLMNDPDTARLLAVAHPLGEIGDGGSVSDVGTGLVLHRWTPDGDTGDGTRYEVGAGPSAVRASPTGRAFAVLSGRTESVQLVLTSLDANPATAKVGLSLKPPVGGVSDVEWSGDGRSLLMLGTSDGTSSPALWRVALSEDYADAGAFVSVAELPGPPMQLEVNAANDDAVVACGQGANGTTPHLLVIHADGGLLAQLDDDFSVPNDMALSPDGHELLITSALFGDEVHHFRIGDTAIVRPEPQLTTVTDPYGVIFHPAPSAGPVALVSDLSKNKVTPITFVSGSPVVGTPQSGVPLAAEMDIARRGGGQGVVFVSAVDTVHWVRLSPSGSVTQGGTAASSGTGAAALTGSVSVQR